MAQAKGKRAVVANFPWYDNTFQERIRPSDIDETTFASLKTPGQVTLVAHWIGKDLGFPSYPIVAKGRYTTIYQQGSKTLSFMTVIKGPHRLVVWLILILTLSMEIETPSRLIAAYEKQNQRYFYTKFVSDFTVSFFPMMQLIRLRYNE